MFDKIAHTSVNGKLVLNGLVSEAVTGISYTGASKKILLETAKGTQHTFDRVIWAAPKWASQMNSDLVTFLQGVEGNTPPGAADTASALRELHIVNSSKAVMLTTDKFWLKNGLPANIQSDTIVRGLYCLDYTPDQSPDGLGVVIVSYTWQDDSAKQIALPQDKEARMKRLVEDVAQIDATFASHLVPRDGDYEKNTIFVDWMTEPNYHGAFKLNTPKQDRLLQPAYLNFTAAGTAKDPHVYIAGDDVSFEGGWCEGAIETALNAAAAVGVSLGGKPVSPSPFDTYTGKYDYSVGGQ